MKKKKGNKGGNEAYSQLLEELHAAGRDYAKASSLLAEVEQLLADHKQLKPNAQLLVHRGNDAYAQGKTEEALRWYQEAEYMALRDNDLYWRAEAVRMKGTMYQYLDANIMAERSLQEAIDLFTALGETYSVAACLHSMSLIYNETGEFEKYIEVSEEALRMLRASGVAELSYARAYVLTMSTRSSVLIRMKLYKWAKEVLDEVMASDAKERAGAYAQQVLTLEYGQYLARTGQYAISNEVMLKMIRVSEDSPTNNEIARMNSTVAQNMIELGRYKDGEKYIKVSMDYFRENKAKFYVAENLICYALLLAKQRKAKEAEACIMEAEELMKGTKSDYYLWKYMEARAYYHAQTKQYEAAYNDLNEARQHEETCLRADYDKKLRSISERNELSAKERQNQLLQKDLEMKKQELTMASDFLNQKVELLKELKGFMKQMRKENIQKNDLMKAMDRKIDSVINVEQEQQIFMEKIEVSGNDFVIKLRKKYPVLSQTEVKVCSLLRNGFSTKDIANLLVTSVRTIENHRYNIRKKLGIKGDESLDVLLNDLD